MLRFFAAFIVMFFHFAFWSWAPQQSTPKSVMKGIASFPELAPYSWWGWVGVPVFFVISGYVITASAERYPAPLRFLRGRFLRLVPAAMLCATITLVVAAVLNLRSEQVLLEEYIRSIFFWPFGPWIDGVYWTLGIEIAFYSLVFLLLTIKRLPWLEKVITVIGLASVLRWLLSYAGISIPWLQQHPRVTDLLLLSHGMYFAIGVLLYRARSVRLNPRRMVALGLLILGGFLPIYSQGHDIAGPHDIAFATPFAVWLTTLGLLWMAGPADKLFTDNALRRVILVGGLATYPLYLIHQIVGATLLRNAIVAGIPSWVALLYALAAMTCTAIILVKLETNLRRGFQIQRQ